MCPTLTQQKVTNPRKTDAGSEDLWPNNDTNYSAWLYRGTEQQQWGAASIQMREHEREPPIFSPELLWEVVMFLY